MKIRKQKKIKKEGTVFVVIGTDCAFMSVGMKSKSEVASFNGFNLVSGKPVKRADGFCRVATKAEKVVM